MKIDAHQHFWKYTPEDYGWISDEMSILRRDFLPGDLKNELKRLDFNGSIAAQARQTIRETEWLLQLAKEYDFIKGVEFVMSGMSSNARLISDMRKGLDWFRRANPEAYMVLLD